MAEEEREPKEMEIFCEDETVCPICQAEFIDVDDLQTHILQVHQSERSESQEPSDYQRHLCRFCNTDFASALEFALHIRDSHIVNIKTCAFCTRAFTARQMLWKHESNHSLDKSTMFSCSGCPMMFTELSDLEYHEIDSHNEGPGMMLQPYYAELSSVLCSQADSFMQRVGKKSVYKCVCIYSTEDIMEYVKHIQTKRCHCYVCNKCNKVFSTKKQIVQHVRTVKCQRPKNISLIKCSKCYKVVMKKDVNNHKRRCKSLSCIKCQLTFDSLEELSTHKQEKHSNQSIILMECRYCSKSLVGLEMFKKHVETQHSLDYLNYKYNCVYCEKIFDHPQRLFSHFNSKHRKLRPFVCNICNQTFLLRSKFTYHIKLDHQSKGFIEFTKDLNVHFNAKKSPKAVTLTSPASLFTSAEEDELKRHGIELSVSKQSNIEINSKVKKEPKLPATEIEKTKETVELRTENEETEELTEIEQPVETDKPKETDGDFQSSDDEPIKKMKIKKGKYSRKLICNICEQKCYTRENYNRHMQSHQTNKGLKQCLKCREKFKTIGILKSHIKKRHTTSLIDTLKSVVEKRKQKIQTQATIIRKEGFICNIEKVFIEPDYRPAAKLVPCRDSKPSKINNTGEDRALLKILSQDRAAAKKKTSIVMKKCVFDETVEPPKRGIKIQQCETLYHQINNYEPATLDTYDGPFEKPKFNFTYSNYVEDDGHYEDDILTYHNDTNNEESQGVGIDQESVTPAPIKPELFMIQSPLSNDVIPETSTLLIPNEQTKQFGKISVATMYFTETGRPAYKIIPFKIHKEELIEENEYNQKETETLVGGPTLIQSNPLAHLMSTEQMSKQKLLTKKYYKPKLDNPQLRIAKALMELKMPNTRKKQDRCRPARGRYFKKDWRPENSDAFKYEILDDDAGNWTTVTEE